MISVLLAVYNSGRYLSEAIDSILAQTERDFELIIIDDGSTNDCVAVLEHYAAADSRVRLYRQENRGLAASLNRAIELSRGEFLARQDHDDVSLPERFSKQIKFLAANPSVDVVGTWASILVDDQKTERALRHPTGDAELRTLALFDSPFVHASVMMRKAAVVAAGMYPTSRDTQPPEDYVLWSRMAARGCHFANIPEELVRYRELSTSITRTVSHEFPLRMAKAGEEYARALLGKKFADVPLAAVYHGIPSSKPVSLWRALAKYRALWLAIHEEKGAGDALGRRHVKSIIVRSLKARFAKTRTTEKE